MGAPSPDLISRKEDYVATPRSRHELTLRPEYKLLTLRDAELDARTDADQAIETAGRTVAAATPYEIYIKVAQLDLPVLAQVEVWDTAPAGSPSGPAWSLAGRFEMPFPSGHLVLGDGSGQAIDGAWLPRNPGIYQAEVWTAGRTEAQAAAQRINEATQDLTTLDKIRYQEQHGSSIEQYTFRVWWLAPLQDDDGTDEDG